MRTLLVLVVATGCGRAASPDRPATGTGDPVTSAAGLTLFPGVLTAPATVRSSTELTAHLVITNPGPDELRLTRGALELAMFALEVHDAADQRVPTVPPPVPLPEDAEPVVLAAGGKAERDYGLHIFSPPLPAGRYTLHCRVVACAPVRFTVAP